MRSSKIHFFFKKCKNKVYLKRIYNLNRFFAFELWIRGICNGCFVDLFRPGRKKAAYRSER